MHCKTYLAKQSSELYPTARDSTDWTFGEYDAVSFTIELRPATAEKGGVHPAVQRDEIQPC